MNMPLLLIMFVCVIGTGCTHGGPMTQKERWRTAIQAHKATDYATALQHYQALLDDPATPTTAFHAILYWKSEAELKTGDTMAAYRTRQRLVSEHFQGPYSKFLGRVHYVDEKLLDMSSQQRAEASQP